MLCVNLVKLFSATTKITNKPIQATQTYFGKPPKLTSDELIMEAALKFEKKDKDNPELTEKIKQQISEWAKEHPHAIPLNYAEKFKKIRHTLIQETNQNPENPANNLLSPTPLDFLGKY